MDGNALGVGYIGCMCKELVDHVGWDWFSYIASFVFVFFFNCGIFDLVFFYFFCFDYRLFLVLSYLQYD